MSLLEVRGLSRSFGALKAVDDVSFSLEAGRILGFIGPNGAGKSTAMRIIASLDVPSGGDVLLDGHSVVERPELTRPLIGYMPDRYGTYEDMTVFEFLDFFALAYRLRKSERLARVREVMDFTGLAPLGDKLTSELSKGMKQRVALGRTLLHDPKLLILDEPADGLDPRARIELRELLRALAARGKAVLISSHILTELAEVIDACAIIEQGRLLALGSVEEVLAREGRGAAAVPVAVRFAVDDDGRAAVLASAERLLLEQPRVADVLASAEGVGFRLEPGSEEEGASARWREAACARVLKALVDAGLPVSSFEVQRKDLEDAFLSVTQGRVQ